MKYFSYIYILIYLNMKREFVPLEIAIKLKQLGFDKNCIAYYQEGKFMFASQEDNFNFDSDDWLSLCTQSAALWQQVIDWLTEKYSIDISIIPQVDVIPNKFYFYCIFRDGKEIDEDKFGDILDKSYQDVEGNYVNDELLKKFLFEDGYAFNTYAEAREHAILKSFSML